MPTRSISLQRNILTIVLSFSSHHGSGDFISITGKKTPLEAGTAELYVCKATFYTAKLLIAGIPYINHPLSMDLFVS